LEFKLDYGTKLILKGGNNGTVIYNGMLSGRFLIQSMGID